MMSMRIVSGFSSFRRLITSPTLFQNKPLICECSYLLNTSCRRRFFSGKHAGSGKWSHSLSVKRVSAVAATVVAGSLVYGWMKNKLALTSTVQAESGNEKKPIPKFNAARSIKSNTDDTGLKLTLYQYQTCPFCCKLRAYLDYRGFSYDVVEVNSVWRTQIKWSPYKKVPIMVVEGVGTDGYIQLKDSSVICSILESFLVDRSRSIEQLDTYYPVIESKNQKGKTEYDWPNRYFIMFGENKPDGSKASQKEERKWRHWTDSVLVHTLSPNIYRTSSEAIQAFNWFSENGEWEKHFSTFERKVVIYVGSVVMYFVGKMLIKKYNLKDDVRESLYDACREWTKAVGKKRKFLGGDRPNLADLSVYGVLSAIEGCQSFQDALNNTDIGNWFYRMKDNVNRHEGAMAMSSFRKS